MILMGPFPLGIFYFSISPPLILISPFTEIWLKMVGKKKKRMLIHFKAELQTPISEGWE